MPQINAYDAAPGRTVEVVAGDLFEEALKVDLLVISAWEGFYEPEPGSMVAVLERRCGLVVQKLQQAPELDLRGASTIRAWITPELDTLTTPPQWPAGSSTRFRRLAVVEGPRNAPVEGTEQTVFHQLFRLLSLLPLHGIDCGSVATPLLNTGRQKAEPGQLYPAMLNAIANGFRHLPDLQQLVIFDLKEEPLQKLCGEIDHRLNRTPLDFKPIELDDHQVRQVKGLIKSISIFRRRCAKTATAKDVSENLSVIERQVQSGWVEPVMVGIAARKILEVFVPSAIEKHRIEAGPFHESIYGRIARLSRHLDPWIEVDLNTMRVFGNWMAHATPESVGQQIPRRSVGFNDLLSMLLALQRVLEQFPWQKRKAPTVRYRDKPQALPIKEVKPML